MSKIIWLASYPKSGNTWMRAFLHNLLRDPSESYDINKITDFSTSDSAIEWYSAQNPKPWQDWTALDVAKMRRGAQQAICRWRKDDTFVKTHNASVVFLGYPLIHQDLTAGTIYIVRNPLDVAISLTHHYGCDLDTAIGILADPSIGSKTNDKIVYEVHKSWSIHVDSWTSQKRPGLAVLRYEDMLADPMRVFGGLAQFLGLNPPKARLQRAVERSSFKALRAQEDKKGFKEKSPHAQKFFREGRAEQWREVMTQSQIDKVVAAHKEMMQRFGYLPRR
ncbi:MAG: sulfotransferase domain-containing protein [Rhodospirillaceae bacterium]|nr:sulfotransferase domain-containing protein [Rhodospirillaceae bacterium]